MKPVKLLTPDELSQLLDVPKRTLDQWRYLGNGPAFVRIGRHCRYRPEDVAAWLEVQRVGGAA